MPPNPANPHPHPHPIAPTLSAQLSLTRTSPPPSQPSDIESFQTTFHPARMGNTANYAYGGCALGAAVQAAYQTVSAAYKPYSISGSFLAPVSTEVKLDCSVRRLRDTRTFATRVVEVSQVQPQPLAKPGGKVAGAGAGSGSGAGGGEGKRRLCMIVLADFHREGEDALLRFSAQPERQYSAPERCLTPQETARRMVVEGKLSGDSEEEYNVLFGLMARLFETRLAPEGIGAQNLTGMAKREATTQDSLHITAKTTADWIRCRAPLEGESDQYAGLAFILDAYLSFLAGVHSRLFLDDAAACASLDFAMRVFGTGWDLNQWNLREMKTVAGGEGRTYSEARLWDCEGRLVANMTQQSILRPKKGESVKAVL
ncbi:acyl-CoA thioesterase II [Aspergillus heterothallicus]